MAIARWTWLLATMALLSPAPVAAAPWHGDSDVDGAGVQGDGDGNDVGAPTTDVYLQRIRELSGKVEALRARIGVARRRLGVLRARVLHAPEDAKRFGVVHRNRMDKSFVPVRIVYTLDGAELLARADAGGVVAPDGELPVFERPLPPGAHVLSVTVVYRGSDSVFSYLQNYTFTARGSHAFHIDDSGTERVIVTARPRGNVLTTAMEDRPGIDFQVVRDE